MLDYWLSFIEAFYEFLLNVNAWRWTRLHRKAIIVEFNDVDKYNKIVSRMRFLTHRYGEIKERLWHVTWRRYGITEFFTWR